MKTYQRIFVIVLDSLGVGALPDAASYGDAGTNTLGHIAEYQYKAGYPLQIPHLQQLGIGNLLSLDGIAASQYPLGYYCRMREASKGKDTMTGHWELMGLETKQPFQTFPEGFPEKLIHELEERTGRNIIGNKSASGTAILEELGEEELKDGSLIVYTSADSVLQICGNEEVMGLENLYHYCKIARELTMKPEWMVGRVIARPYIGRKKGTFHRTANRHDYAVKPFGKTALDALKEAGLDVISIGKIKDIFDGEGITKAEKSNSSIHGMDQTIALTGEAFRGLCFTNLVDFDALWGHRRDPAGYARELEHFDIRLGLLMKKLQPEDLLILTADHGNDPLHTGTDHTREAVPFIAWSPSMSGGSLLPETSNFAMVGATILDNFEVPMPEGTIGTSYLSKL